MRERAVNKWCKGDADGTSDAARVYAVLDEVELEKCGTKMNQLKHGNERYRHD